MARRPPDEDFGARLRHAKRKFEAERDPERVTNERIGQLVGDVLGRPPITSQAVSRWLLGHVPDQLATIRALALVLGVEPGWLAFGEGSDDVRGEILKGGK